jgi:hypothetical protein
MTCEHLLRGKHALYGVVQGLMAPSLFETYSYCTSDDPSRCPLYQRSQRTRERVPLEVAAILIEAADSESGRRTALRNSSSRVEAESKRSLSCSVRKSKRCSDLTILHRSLQSAHEWYGTPLPQMKRLKTLPGGDRQGVHPATC